MTLEVGHQLLFFGGQKVHGVRAVLGFDMVEVYRHIADLGERFKRRR